jgi:hypothetical protein
MILPALLSGLLIASLYGAMYHLARGGGALRLLLYLVLAWAGFAAGHLLGSWFGWFTLRLGTLNILAASIGSLIFLAAGDWLSHLEQTG